MLAGFGPESEISVPRGGYIPGSPGMSGLRLHTPSGVVDDGPRPGRDGSALNADSGKYSIVPTQHVVTLSGLCSGGVG